MKFGPFTAKDMKRIVGVLEELDIPFDFNADEKELEEKMTHWKQQSPLAASLHLQWLDTSHIYVDISESSFDRLGDRLIEFGIGANLPTPDPALPELTYGCPQCPYGSDQPGICPTHQAKLITFGEYMNSKNSGLATFAAMADVIPAALAALAVVGATIFAYFS